MEELKFTIQDRFANRKKEVIIQNLIHPSFRARIATALIEKWGLMAFDTDGEDSAGRAKGALLEPWKVVDRACAMADGAVSEFEKRGWLIAIPTVPEDETKD